MFIQCRKFKDSELVRQRSNEFFNKLYELFSVNHEQFMQSFEKERIKYLHDCEKEIKKEKIWKEKCLHEDKQISIKKHKMKYSKILIEDHLEQSNSNCFDSEAHD